MKLSIKNMFKPQLLWLVGVMLILLQPHQASAAASDAVRNELRGFIENVSGASAKRESVKDSLGQSMDCLKVIQTDGKFVAVYHQNGYVNIATSTDCMNWTFVNRLSSAGEASQPYLYQSGSSYILAWEREVNRTVVLRWFTSAANLYANRDDGTRCNCNVPIGGWIGTPNIYSGNHSSVDVGFHYWDGSKDQNARGTCNWSTLSGGATQINDALRYWGCWGNIGDRDGITYKGYQFSVVEGQQTFGDFGTWHLYLYDHATGNADPCTIRTPGSPNGVNGIGNPNITLITINGQSAVLCTAFDFSTPGAGGPCIWYNYLTSGGGTVIQPGVYNIGSYGNSGTALQGTGDTYNNGSGNVAGCNEVAVTPFNRNLEQEWTFISIGNNQWHIRNNYRGKLLQATGDRYVGASGPVASCNKLALTPEGNNSQQVWVVTAASAGGFVISNPNNAQYVQSTSDPYWSSGGNSFVPGCNQVAGVPTAWGIGNQSRWNLMFIRP